MVVEVSDSTVRYDRRTKMPPYADAGIEKAWLVNLPGKALKVYRSPANGKYQIVQKLGRNDGIAPLNFPNYKFPFQTSSIKFHRKKASRLKILVLSLDAFTKNIFTSR